MQQRLTQCLRVLLEVLERELDQRRLVRDAPGEVRETRIVRDPVRGNLAAEALVVELREEELELRDVGRHAFEALHAPARTSLLVTRGPGSGLPPRIYLPIVAVTALVFLGIIGYFLRIGLGVTGSALGPAAQQGDARLEALGEDRRGGDCLDSQSLRRSRR